MMERFGKIGSELLSSPVNVFLVGVICFLVYKIIRGRKEPLGPVPEPPLPKLKKQDFTLDQLREYDGSGPEGRVLLAVNGKIFDVTRGKNFYGPSRYFLFDSILFHRLTVSISFHYVHFFTIFSYKTYSCYCYAYLCLLLQYY